MKVQLLILALSAFPATAWAGDLGEALNFLDEAGQDEAVEGYEDLVDEPKHEALAMINARDTVVGTPLSEYQCSDTHLDKFVMRSKSIQRWGHRQCLILRFALDELPDFVTLGPPRLRPEDVRRMIAPVARKTDVPEYLIEVIIMFRSGYRPAPVAKSGHVGIMGLHPDHLEDAGLPSSGLLDPRRNIQLGARYLARLFFELKSIKKVMFAYPIGLRAYKAGQEPDLDTVAFVREALRLYYAEIRPFPTDLGVDSMAHVLEGFGGF